LRLAWLATIFNAGRLPFDIVKNTRAFDKPFYQVDISDCDLATLVAWPPADKNLPKR
jgi:hypothetical protein